MGTRHRRRTGRAPSNDRVRMRFDETSVVLDAAPGVMIPSVFTNLIANAVPPFCEGSVLDMGSGSGILGILAALRGARSVVCADIDAQCVSASEVNARLNGCAKTVECRRSDLFRNLRRRRFDLILFNPPTFPDSFFTPGSSRGGGDGRGVLDGFIRDASDHLTKGGRALVTVSSLADPKHTIKNMERQGLTVRQRSVVLAEFRQFYYFHMEFLSRLQKNGDGSFLTTVDPLTGTRMYEEIYLLEATRDW